MKKIIVHGVHRSGTSLTANILSEAGCWYATEAEQMPSQTDNPNGFWERLDVVRLNDSILSALNLNWFTLLPELNKDQLLEIDKQFGAKIEDVITTLNSHPQWFIKDPRLSITWPIWKKHAGATHHIVVNRHPMSVARSLEKRNGIPIRQGLVFWFHQMRMIASSLEGEENVFTLEFSPNSKAKDTYKTTLLSIFKDSESEQQAIESKYNEIFKEDLIHQKEIDESSIDIPVILEAWESVKLGKLNELLELPPITASNFTWSELDSRYVAFNEREIVVAENSAYKKEIDGAHKKLNDQLEIITSLNEEMLSRNKWISSLDDQISSLNEDVLFLNKENSSLNKEVLSRNNWISSLDEQIVSLDQKAISSNQEISSLNEEISSLNEEISSQNDIRDELNTRLITIAGKSKQLIESKRYTVFSIFFKVLSRLRIAGQSLEIHEIFNMAKFGHSASDLEQALPKVSNRKLMIKALVREPRSILRKLSFGRIINGVATMFGRRENDPGITQALSTFERVEGAISDDLDIFDPENSEAWIEQGITFEVCKKPTVSIVIPVYNQFLMTMSCLRSIQKNTDFANIDFEVIVADDCSNDETKNITKIVKGIKVIKAKKNVGFLKNCNGAVPKAKGEYVVLLNNDTNVQAGWLEALLEPLVENKNVGVTGPMFLYPDGRLQEAGGIIFSDASGWNYGRFEQPDKPEYKYSRDVDYVSGACMVFRKSLWKEIGGFDELFMPAYYEDTDFCFAARKRKLTVRYVANSKVVHFEGISHGTGDSGIKAHQRLNKEKFAKKWQQELDEEHFSGPEFLFKARNHGRNKKVLLFVDHYVPFHDKDAGSKVAQRYIELLLEQDIHVIFLGDNFYPHQPYTNDLEVMGVEVLYGEHYNRNWFEWLSQNSKHIDAIYLNRPHISVEYIDKILSLENVPHLSYHGADLHYIRVRREESLGLKATGGKTAAEWKELEFTLMKKCNISLWLSDLEVQQIREEDASINTAYIPMYWFEESEILSGRKVIKDKNLLFVGGFGHPPNLDGLKWFLDEVFPSIVDKHPDVKLTVIGSNCPDEVKQLGSDNIEILGFVSEQELIDAYSTARLSVVPLRYGAGVKGKVIESMQFGVSVITTSIGAEGLPGDPSNYLSVVNEPAEFTEMVLTMLESDEVCQNKVSKSNQALKQHFSKQSAIQAVDKIMGNEIFKGAN